MLTDDAMVKAYYGDNYSTKKLLLKIMDSSPKRIVIMRKNLSNPTSPYKDLKIILDSDYEIEYSPNKSDTGFIVYAKK